MMDRCLYHDSATSDQYSLPNSNYPIQIYIAILAPAESDVNCKNKLFMFAWPTAYDSFSLLEWTNSTCNFHIQVFDSAIHLNGFVHVV